MKVFWKSARLFSAASLGMAIAISANAQSVAGDHTLQLSSDQVTDTNAHDFDLSDIHPAGASTPFSDTWTLVIDKFVRVSSVVAENTGIESFTSFGLFSTSGTEIAGSDIQAGTISGASLIITDLLPGTYQLKVSGVYSDFVPGRYSISADAVATPIPTAAWFFAPAIATVFGIRRKGRLLQSA